MEKDELKFEEELINESKQNDDDKKYVNEDEIEKDEVGKNNGKFVSVEELKRREKKAAEKARQEERKKYEERLNLNERSSEERLNDLEIKLKEYETRERIANNISYGLEQMTKKGLPVSDGIKSQIAKASDYEEVDELIDELNFYWTFAKKEKANNSQPPINKSKAGVEKLEKPKSISSFSLNNKQ